MSVYDDPPWVRRYVGVPFAASGFDFDGWHCWGLVWRAFHDEKAIDLPRHGPLSASDILAAARAIRSAKALPPWQAVALPGDGEPNEAFARRVRRGFHARAFDVATMFDGDAARESHVGLMIGPRRLIHVEERAGTVKADLLDPSIAWRLTGIYRHEALA